MLRFLLFVVLCAASAVVNAEPAARWLAHPVSDRSIPDVLPVDWQGDGAATLRLAMTPGEYRAASFLVEADANLKNVLPVATSLDAGDALTIPASQVDIRIVKQWYQAAWAARTKSLKPHLVSELLLKDDALVNVEDGKNYLKLTSGEYIDISQPGQSRQRGIIPIDIMPVRDASELQPVGIQAGHNRQFWVTFLVPADAVAGVYSGVILVRADGAAVAELNVELEVLPFTLEPSMLVYSIFHRAMLNDNQPEGAISSEVRSDAQYRAELDNLVAHGVTQPNLYQRSNSPEFERALRLRQEAGVDQRELFLIGLPAVPGGRSPVPIGFENKVRDTQKKVAKYGVEQLYVWGRDEAKADRLLEQKPVWTFARELDAKVFVAGYHTTAPTGPGNFDLMGPLHDTFVAINPVSREEAGRWHSIDKRIFSYQNPTGGMERPQTFRQTHGLFLWQMDYDGVMPYAYNDSFGNGWNDFDHAVYRDHNFVYPTMDGVVDTLQWEGLREGVVDVRYLSTLKAAMEQSDNQQLRAEISVWLEQLKAQPLARIDFDQLRGTFAGYILALDAATPVAKSGAPTGLRFIPADRSGQAYVEFETDERAAVALRYGSTPALNDGKVEQSALKRLHRLAIPAAAAGSSLYVQAVANNTTAPVLSEIVELRAGSPLALQVDLMTEGDEEVLSLTLDTASAAQTVVDVDDSLLGWWRYSETEGDTAANFAGMASPMELSGDARWAEGYMGGGLQLDGSGDFAYASDLDIAAGSPVTIEAWVKFNQFALERGIRQGIFTGLYQHQVNNHLYLHGTGALFEAASLLQLNVWQHIVLTHNGSMSSAVLYIDGQAVPISVQSEAETMPAIDGFAAGRSSGFFGGILAGGTTQLDGSVDEVRIWNRMFSDAEVQAAFGQSSAHYKMAYPASNDKGHSYRVISTNLEGETVEQRVAE